MKALYRFFWDYGRMGNVEGLFIEHTSEVDKRIGSEVYFGEILGKHSEVYGDLDRSDLEMICDDQEKVLWLEGLLGSNLSGYNPIEAIREREEE